MPRTIDVNGKPVRVWDDKELMARYQQGRTDAGDPNSSQHIHSEEDLKKAYESGAKSQDRVLGAAVRSGFEQGFREGEEVGKNLGQREAMQGMQDEIKKVRTEAYRVGFQSGEEMAAQKSHPDAIKIGIEQGKRAAQTEFAAQREQIGAEAVKQYRQSNTATGRMTRWLSSYVRFTPNGLFHSLMSAIGRLPLSRNHFVRDAEYDISVMRVRHIRRFPVQVPLRFMAFYVLPIVLIKVLTDWTIDNFLMEPFKAFATKRERIEYGETKTQFNTRKKVEATCDKIESLTPAKIGLAAFTPEQQLALDKCGAQCADARQSYQLMLETMRKRRATGIGNQRYYGVRKAGGHYDVYDYKDKIRASEGVNPEIEATLEKVFVTDVSPPRPPIPVGGTSIGL